MASSSSTSFPSWRLVDWGKQPPVADLPPQDAQKNRFSRCFFRRFLGVFARKEHPLALFLDDLQWLDCSNARPPRASGYALRGCGTCCWSAPYRDNEVGPRRTRFCGRLEAIRKAGALGAGD